MLLKAFRSEGVSIGIAGAKNTSAQFAADAVAWDHPDGDTAGTVDLLANCKFYVGNDSGVSHLASMMQVPSLVFRKDYRGGNDLIGVMERANKRFHRRLPNEAWYKPDEVVKAAIDCLETLGIWRRKLFP
jgi:ADP-heptose:LPS heptosyltransferase